ncbi:MAG: SLBB domain-containing protein [Candidatus Acidiferrales bacterium]
MKVREFIRSVMASVLRKQFGGMAVIVFVLSMLACSPGLAQNRQTAAMPPSDLARQNLEQVAASAAQIESILHKDTGLLVELKRWVAKDATSHGQLISDADLADQAIYDRLQTDLHFRFVATVLLQQYGYLLPQVNPDSAQGKEQELLIQERAKWLAQDEEEQLTQARQQTNRNLEQTRDCDLRVNQECNTEQRTTPANQQPHQIGAPNAPQNFSPNAPSVPRSPQRGLPTLEETELMQTGAETPISSAQLPLGSPHSSLDALVSAPVAAGAGTLVQPEATNEMQGQFPQIATVGQTATQGEAVSGNLNSANLETNPQEYPYANVGSLPETNNLPGSSRSSPAPYGATTYNPTQRRYMPAELSPSQTMVRRPDPYLDVPSLYDMYLQAAPQSPAPERFGMEIFENGTRDSQMIPFDLPVGPDYVVGPGDGLAIDLWGGVSQRLLRTVDKEGRLSLPEVGPVLVAGKSLADVQQSVQQTLRSQFRDVSADVSLARLRTIRVYVVGDVVNPGAYDISSLSTPLNALFAADGPTSQGSLRILEHNRGNQLIQSVDVYDLLLHGVKTDIQRLENGDTVLVPPIGPEITVEGMVRRPAVYELKNEKSLSDVLTLAGGLLPTATLRHVEVQRVVAHEKRTMLSLDIPPGADSVSITKQFDSFPIQDGDKIRIFPIAPYNQDTVYLEGHVLRPGRYSYHHGMRVTDLISSYKDILPEPANQYAEIIRLNPPDYRPTVESFNLADALSRPGSAPLLDPLDTVQIFGRYDFENPPTVSVWGDVREPGTYRTSGQIHLSDAVHMAGGLAPDAETEDAQVFRYLPDGQLKIFSVKLNEALGGDSVDNILLNSRDRILVHRNPAEVDPATVYVKGEVARPGRYPLTSNMTVADLIRAAGSLQQSADLNEADLTRYQWKGQTQIAGDHKQIALNAAMAGDASANIPLHNGDVLTIRQLPGWNDLGAAITVRGEVTHPGSYGIKPGERLSSILMRAGGLMPDAYPYGALLRRDSVRDLEANSQQQLYERIKGMQTQLKLASTTDPDQKAAQETAYQQWQTALQDLADSPPIGRVTIQISSNVNSWKNTSRDIAVRAGDTLIIPKRPSYVMVQGQVYNATAVSYRPGRSAKWYLSQAGGPTNLANKRATFVIRADGTVIGSHGSSLWMGGGLDQSLQPGDTVVVPEKALGGPRNWQAFFQMAQVLSGVTTSAILAAHY